MSWEYVPRRKKWNRDGAGDWAALAFEAEPPVKALLRNPWNFISLSFSFPFSYDSSGTSKDEIKERFAQTMEFVEEYLRDVVCQRFPFSDKEKNKLTFEVTYGKMICAFYLLFCGHFCMGYEKLFSHVVLFIVTLCFYSKRNSA